MMTALTPAIALPPGFRLRPLADRDLDALVALFIACGQREYGRPDWTREDLLADWPGRESGTDTWVVEAPAGPVVAYAALSNRPGRYFSNVYVDPAWADAGLTDPLLDHLEARARERMEERPAEAPPDRTVVMVQYVAAVNPARQHLLAARGYAPWRREATRPGGAR